MDPLFRRRRIDYPDDGTAHAQALAELAAYQRAAADGEHLAAARHAAEAERVMPNLVDTAITAAAEATSARRVAAELGLTHGGVNYRLRRHAGTTSTDSDSDTTSGVQS